MNDEQPEGEQRSETKTAIMYATLETLQEHGYAGLTMSRIAGEADINQSSIYNHYETKDELLSTFLEFVIDQIEVNAKWDEIDDPTKALECLLSYCLGAYPDPAMGTANEKWPAASPKALNALIDLRVQGIHNEEFALRIADVDQQFQTEIEEIIERGIERAVFRDVDANHVAAMVFTLLLGGVVRQATTTDGDGNAIKAQLQEYLEADVLADNSSIFIP